MRRFFKRLPLRVLLLTLAVAVVYSFTDRFARQWREFVMEQLEGRGVHIEFSRFGLHPIDGLVARDVRVFNDEGHQHVLMTIDRLNLDIDYGKLLERKFFVEGLELTDANVALPLDPDQPEAGQVDIRNLSARVYLMDDRLDIRKAEGKVAGVQLSVTGSILLPQPKERTQAEIEQDQINADKRMAFLREKRGQIQEALHWLQRFTFTREPRLALEVSGVADKLENLSASLQFSAGGLGYESYTCKELSARADYNAGVIDVRQLRLRDRVGTFEASATWDMSADDVRFRLHTTADLPQLAKSFLQSDALREVVFYESAPPSLTLDGTWFVKGPKSMQTRPVEALGEVQCGRFNSRGEVFEGISASFGVAPEGFYIRDGLLRHKTGSFALQAMFREVEGFKYRAVLRMDPHAFLPFAEGKDARELIQRFEFNDSSTIFVRMEGAGPQASLDACRNVGRAEFRELKYRGVDFASAAGEIDIFNGQMEFRKVAVALRSGVAEAGEVVVNDDEHWVKLTGVKAKLDPVPLTSCFARETAQAIAPYHLSPSTEVGLEGTIHYGAQDRSDFVVKFRAPEGTGTYPLWKRDYLIQAPQGTLGFKGSKMTYDIKGRVFGGAMAAKGHVDLAHDASIYDVDLSAEHFLFRVLGKDLMFDKLKAEIKTGKASSPFDIQASVLGGSFGMKGMIDWSARPTQYKGALQLNALSFQRFAKVYAPEEDSEGDVTGHMEFTGKVDDWQSLKGSGVLILLNGNLYAVPVLGPLTPLLGALLPRPIKGYNVAREANCTFRVADGFLVTKDFEALTSTFKIISHGTVDFIKDDVEFTAQVRVRGLPGLVLLPVSELLEYKGEGTVAKTTWRSHFFSVGEGRKRDERKPPTAAELGAAARAAQMTAPQAEPAPDKPRVNPLTRPGR